VKIVLLATDLVEYSAALANGLARESDVWLLVPEEPAEARRGLDDRVTLVLFRKPRLRQPLRQLGMCRALLRRIREIDPDVVHLQQGHLWFNLALPLLRSYPLVLTIHDHTHHPGDAASRKTPQAAMTFGFRRADRVIVHGHTLKREVVKRWRLSEATVDVVPHVALGDRDARAVGRDDGTTVLFFGRIWPYKGLEYLIRAEPLVAAEVPDVRIVIAGSGEDLGRYRRLMAHPECFSVYDEFVPNERRAELFAEASVVVLPYVEASQSGVVPVAYAHGKPVVATTVGALPEVVDDGRTGFLVPPRDEAALARAIVRLLRDSKLRRELGTNARRKLDTELAPEAVARKTLAVYERAMRTRGAGGAQRAAT
jgi:glycosyltransferase involved in cell wall biosynthesis